MTQTKITIQPDPALAELKRIVSGTKSQSAAAEGLDVTESYLSYLLSGKRKISAAILNRIGYKRIIVHVPAHAAKRIAKQIEQIVAEVLG